MPTTYRSKTSSHEFAFSPEQVWPFLLRPDLTATFHKEPCYEVTLQQPLNGVKGETWNDVHIGEACTGDVVKNSIRVADRVNGIFEYSGTQTGIRQTTHMKLTPAANGGCVLTETITFSPAMPDKFGMSLMAWAMLFTGILAKWSEDEDADLHWYRQLDNALRAEYAA